MYTVSFENVAVTAAQDFFEIDPAAEIPCYIHAVHLSQSSDVGDAEEEILRIRVIRVPATATSGSGGSAGDERRLDLNDAAASFVSEVNNTTVATTTGTLETVHTAYPNIRTGWDQVWSPETRPRVQNGELLVVRLDAAPADSLTMGGTIYVEEV